MISGLSGTVTAHPITGEERDEIAALVSRIKRADDGRKKPQNAAPMVSEQDEKWAESMSLPREFFEFFTIERGA